MRTLITVMLLGLLVSAAQAEWIGFTTDVPASPEIDAYDVEPGRTRIEVTLPGFHRLPVEIDGQGYAAVVLPGHLQRLERGLPQLPFLTAKLAVPGAGSSRAKVVAESWRELPTDPIVPAKGNLKRTVDPASVPYEFGAPYTAGGVYPAEAVELSRPYILRDQRGLNVRINPLRWDADRGLLLALESLTLEIETSGSGGINALPPRDRPVDRQFERLYEHAFLNADRADKYEMVGVEGPMLVVCYDAFQSAIQPFVAWKRQRGLGVEVITTSSVGGTTAGIQAAIDERFQGPDGLTYVVLVGDLAQVPTYVGEWENADDDTRYALVAGDDLYPDLFVSRISGQNPVQIQTQVNKFIRYERDPDPAGEWYHRATGIASNQGTPSDKTRAEWLRDDLLGYGFSFVDQIYQGEGGTTEAIAAAINEGRSLVNYIGHGTGSGWTSVPFYSDDVHALSNGWAQPWIIDVSCSTGDFSDGECFAEAWMWDGSPDQPHGAVGAYASSTATPWVPPCVMQAEAIDLLVADAAHMLGSIYYHGIMAVIDEYGPDNPISLELVEQYNIFGDCSLMVRTDTPAAMSVAHAGVIPLFAPAFAVDTGVAGVTCALYRDGELYGAAVADATGHADIILNRDVETVGDLTLTVFGYNQLTYQAVVQAVVPADIVVEPSVIPVLQTTGVTVIVTDPDSGAGLADVLIAIDGYGIFAQEGVTDGSGVVSFDVTPAFGESLVVRAREVGATVDFATIALPVSGAVPLTDPTIEAAVASLGLDGALVPLVEGNVTAGAAESTLILFLTGGGLDEIHSDQGSEVVVAVTPLELGEITAVLCKTGYEIHTAVIPVVEALGTYAGTVLDADDYNRPVAGVNVRGFPAGEGPEGTPLFDLTTDAHGDFAVDGELPLGGYEIYVTRFRYQPYHETYTLLFGENTHTITVQQSPEGELTGTITEAGDGSPVAATVRVYRGDTGDLFDEVVADSLTGAYATGPLPYFDYTVEVRAFHHLPETVAITIDQATVARDFALTVALGDLLVIDDQDRAAPAYPAKLGKGGAPIAPAYTRPAARATFAVQSELEQLGYNVAVEEAALTDTASWAQYDAVVVSCGDNTETLSPELKLGLVLHALRGGKLLLEGGEIAFDHRYDVAFARNVLHIDIWYLDDAGSVSVVDAGHPVMSVPNAITGPIDLAYAGYGDADACIESNDAARVGGWTGNANLASIICYDPNTAPEGGQIVFFTFNYEALDADTRVLLLQNAITWLLAPEFGDASIAGTVELAGESDHAGVTVTVTPGDLQVVTGSDGAYTVTGLFAGTYHLVATKEGWSSGVADVTLATGEALTGVDFELNPIVTNLWCDTPAAPIPDANPDGVTTTLDIPVDATVSQLAVYVDISHPFVGDLYVELISPVGTTVRLKNVGEGDDGQDWVGWYPDELEPYEDLTPFIGEGMLGAWGLHVVDVGLGDAGVINEWCLRFTYEATTTPAGDGALPRVVSLDGNHPNPFNPVTTIEFALPRTGRAELAVFDLRGRRVRTLVAGERVAGYHEVVWDGRDDGGRVVPSGTYFSRLVAGGTQRTSKMLLLK